MLRNSGLLLLNSHAAEPPGWQLLSAPGWTEESSFFGLLITSSKQYVFAFIDVCAFIKLHWLIALIVTQAVCVCVCGPLALVILWSSVWAFMFCNFSYQSQWSLIRPATSKLFLTHEGKSITQLQVTLFIFISCEWHLLDVDSEAALLIASALLCVMMPLRSSPTPPYSPLSYVYLVWTVWKRSKKNQE